MGDPSAIRNIDSRTTLVIYPVPTSALAAGKAGTSGYDTAYRVFAAACKGRDSRLLATLPTLAQAEAYLQAFSPRFGLIG